MKRCSRCGETKPLSEFGPDQSQRDGYNGWCKPCRAEWARERYNADADYRRNLKRRYGITPEQYDELLASQGYACAVCGSDDPCRKGNRMFSVDHDHETGEVRGLLCFPCNSAIGQMKDDPAIMRRAAEYLERRTSSSEVVANLDRTMVR